MTIELSGKFEEDWRRGLAFWKSSGRVEDLPRSVRVPKYFPSEGKSYGQTLAARYMYNYQGLVEELKKQDEFESLCAFEILELICWEYGIGCVPDELLQLSVPIPPKIQGEIPDDPEVNEFSGRTCGEYFSAVFCT